ncbi:hypothetical protein ACF9IK_03300 [Kitasatospora hibisci]|uniref:hypothetical protein n=1 Tax=Kitasatospora hibisci TaxID=3369522 RepID=UPI003754B8D5
MKKMVRMTFDGWRVAAIGDMTIDWFLEEKSQQRSNEYEDRLRTEVVVRWLSGGVFLLRAMIEQAVDQWPGKTNSSPPVRMSEVLVSSPRVPKERTLKAFKNPYRHSFAVLAEYDPKVRVKEYLGFGQMPGGELKPERYRLVPALPAGGSFNVVVVDDAGLDFRERGNWQELAQVIQPGLAVDDRPWVLLKASKSIAGGDLWKYVVDRIRKPHDWLADRLVLLTSAACLREAGAGISRDLSWERCIEDVVREIQRCPAIKDLAACRRIIVSFGPSGVLYLDRIDDARLCTLAFDRERMERSWWESHRDGTMFGYGSALCATVTRELLLNPDEPDFPRALLAGLGAMGRLYDAGFRRIDNQTRVVINLQGVFEPADEPDLAVVKAVELNHGFESGISLSKRQENPAVVTHRLARHIAVGGTKYFRRINLNDSPYSHDIPIGRFGELVTIDRMEIEGLNSIKNLIMNYRASVKLTTPPLGIATFGAPGSGKSYAVKQIIKTQEADEPIELIEFNLSQFHSPGELVSALHRVRDIALGGKIPLAFWDEFDTPLDDQELGWLRYFLAPIQDGTFQQAETLHRIGASIFVFGGSQFDRFSKFKHQAEASPPESKVLDFLSRLRGYMDIAGIDEQDNESDFMLQRAIVLNALFRRKGISMVSCVEPSCPDQGEHDVFDVQQGVLDAFLTIPSYYHGVRSMMAIMEMSRIRPGQQFVRAALPSPTQLDMHVNGSDFLDFANRGASTP